MSMTLKGIHEEMMSDEENVGSNTLKFTSLSGIQEFNKLLVDLDARDDDASTTKAHPQNSRTIGTVPNVAKEWMLSVTEQSHPHF